MNWDFFETYVPGKWVLAGEHSVLNGGRAVALPHPTLGLRLRFEPQEDFELTIRPGVAAPNVLEILNELLRRESVSSSYFPRGRLEIESTIPLGAGLGSSAAFCVAMVRWMASRLGWSPSYQLELATLLEDRFHGKSSGMDVHVVFRQVPLSFSMDRQEALQVSQLPPFEFHDTGLRSSTRECVERVMKFRETDPQRAREVDAHMVQASELARLALERFQTVPLQLEQLEEAMKLGQRCYDSWGLVPPVVQEQVSALYQSGARAVKLTGAGLGGFLVVLR